MCKIMSSAKYLQCYLQTIFFFFSINPYPKLKATLYRNKSHDGVSYKLGDLPILWAVILEALSVSVA